MAWIDTADYSLERDFEETYFTRLLYWILVGLVAFCLTDFRVVQKN